MSIRKIVVIGPESTGKSSLSEALAGELKTAWVPEYAREYLEKLGRPYVQDDLLAIARGQVRTEDKLAGEANKLLVCDTDLNVIKVWSEHKYQSCHRYVLQEIARRKYDMYLLTNIDVPWTDDPLREHPAPAERAYFYNVYRDIVQNSGVPWLDVRGSFSERLSLCLNFINGFRF